MKKIGDTVQWNTVNGPMSGTVTEIHINRRITANEDTEETSYVVALANRKSIILDGRNAI